MSTIVTRAGKGSALTHTEVDANFTNLNNDKIQSGDTVASLTITSADINGGTVDGTAIGGSSASTGAFTTLSASSTVSGTGFSNYLASPPAIGGTSAAAGTFTALTSTGNTTLGDAVGDTVTVNGTATFVNANPTLSAGTANGLVYLNGSKVATSGSALTYDGTTFTSGAHTVSTGVLTVPAGSNTAPSITFSGDTNTGVFFPAADTVAIGTGGSERVRVDSAGRVGIALTPSANQGMLQVAGAGQSWFKFYDSTVGWNFGTFYKANGTSALAYLGGGGGSAIAGGTVDDFVVRAEGNLLFAAGGGSERMRIDSSGNVGIGTSSPSTYGKFVAYSSGGYGSINTDGHFESYQLLDVATAGGRFRGSSSQGILGRIDINQVTTGAKGGEIRFFTCPSGSNTETERARITSGGYFKASNDGTYVETTQCHELRTTEDARAVIITATNASYSSDGIQIRIARNTTNNSFYALAYFNTGAAAYRFRVADSGNVTNTNNSYGAISDIKLKENVVDATPKLEKLNQVRVVNYNFIGSEQKQLGVIAQELEQIFPGMVEESPDRDAEGNDLGTTTKAVKYSVFVPMLIKAMQEQQAMIEELKAKVAALEAK
jgi:hypothetical protein